jgi:hypothetical protein
VCEPPEFCIVCRMGQPSDDWEQSRAALITPAARVTNLVTLMWKALITILAAVMWKSLSRLFSFRARACVLAFHPVSTKKDFFGNFERGTMINYCQFSVAILLRA